MTSFVRPLDLLLAFKAIALTPLLLDSDKRVACVILDHYNRKTGQCDPSLGTIAKLLDVDRRTVIRAVTRLHKFGFVLRNVHGGKFHRNSYTPIWEKFRQIEALWKARREQQRKNSAQSDMSPWQGPAGHLGGVLPVTRTCLNNSSQVISDIGSSPQTSATRDSSKGPPEKRGGACDSDDQYTSGRRGVAARDAAERRWNLALVGRFPPGIYITIVDDIDAGLMANATDAELDAAGAGLAVVVRELTLRGRLPNESQDG
jgi:predicted transcriptional regulator